MPALILPVEFDVNLLHCHFCLRPLRPPIFQGPATGRAAVAACSSCRGEQPGSFVPNALMDEVVRSTRLPCPHDGCPSFVSVYELEGHRLVCPFAPCYCACGVKGLPPALLDHLTTGDGDAAGHSWPRDTIRYGEPLDLKVSVSEQRRLLVVEEEFGRGQPRVFVLVLDAFGEGRAVSLVCLRGNAAAGPRYASALCADAPGGGRALVDVREVASAADLREMDVQAIDFLGVSRTMMHGDGAAKQLHLYIRIDKAS